MEPLATLAITAAALSLAAAIVFLAFNVKGLIMALDLTGLNTALDDLASGLDAVATSIANLPAANAEAQAAIDAAAERVRGFSATASDLKAAEDAEDAG